MNKERGFTLIELLVVIAIIAILAIAITVGYSTVRKSARDAKRQETVRNIATAEELYYNQNGEYVGCGVFQGSCDLISDGFLNANPSDSDLGPFTAQFADGGQGFAAYVKLEGADEEEDVFCCTEDGCNVVASTEECN